MNDKHALIAGILAGIGASLCCVVPLALLSLGLGGAWVANLAVFAPLRPLFLGLTLLFLALAFRALYLVPPACRAGEPCAEEDVQRRRRRIFWLAAIPLLGLLAFPWYARLFY
ncbi:MAG TPA: mercuric transporter MerT family protein [Methylococcaceae bacterium]|nr:mercuric transporter MerT family protein [Methylococcaceae bacterium]